MRALCLWCVILTVVASAASAAGRIQVSCEPGLRVFLDDVEVGTSSLEQNGFILEEVGRGSHVIRVEKAGFLPQSFQVQVADMPLEIKADRFVRITPTHQSTTDTAFERPEVEGALSITSAPETCVVSIHGQTHLKEFSKLEIEGLPVGRHTISFAKPGFTTVSGEVEVFPATSVKVRGNLFTGTVETIHEGKGSLTLISTPTRCSVSLMGATREKTRPTLKVSHIPAGAYPLVLSIRSQEISTRVLIKDGFRTIVMASFSRSERPFVVSYEAE